jgi:small conductance mechanosensitive channel
MPNSHQRCASLRHGRPPPAPAKVDVKPVARDEEIRKRLQSVLDATGWFIDPQVRVEEGVVFLNGRWSPMTLKRWAGDLARNTQDVVAVANRMRCPNHRSGISVRPGADC